MIEARGGMQNAIRDHTPSACSPSHTSNEAPPHISSTDNWQFIHISSPPWWRLHPLTPDDFPDVRRREASVVCHLYSPLWSFTQAEHFLYLKTLHCIGWLCWANLNIKTVLQNSVSVTVHIMYVTIFASEDNLIWAQHLLGKMWPKAADFLVFKNSEKPWNFLTACRLRAWCGSRDPVVGVAFIVVAIIRAGHYGDFQGICFSFMGHLIPISVKPNTIWRVWKQDLNAQVVHFSILMALWAWQEPETKDF